MSGNSKLWWEIILENWAQTAVILGFISYIIKTIIEWKLNKYKISFSKIQENKIIEVKAFYKSYQTFTLSLKSFLDQTEFGEHKPEIFDKLRRDIRESYIDFEYNCMTVKLFIETQEIKTIENISKICTNIRIDIERWHIYRTSMSPPNDWDKLNEVRNQFDNTLPTLVKKIENSLRKSYNVK